MRIFLENIIINKIIKSIFFIYNTYYFYNIVIS